jgi:hypothetical protein
MHLIYYFTEAWSDPIPLIVIYFLKNVPFAPIVIYFLKNVPFAPAHCYLLFKERPLCPIPLAKFASIQSSNLPLGFGQIRLA